MGLRETLNQRPRLAAAIAAGALLLAIPLMMWANGGPPKRATNAYYSDDEGKTYFTDSIDKVFPFDRNGKPAYRVQLYQCSDGKPFVAYLLRYPDSAKARLADLEKRKASDPEAASQIADLLGTAIEVKRPGEERWVSLLSGQGNAFARHPQCSDGNPARPLSP